MGSTAPTDPLVSPHLEPELVAVRQARGLLLMGPAADSAEIGGVGVADATTHLGRTEIGLDEQRRAFVMRRCTIQSCTVRPVCRRTAVVRCPGLRCTASATSLRDRAAEALLDHREHLILVDVAHRHWTLRVLTEPTTARRQLTVPCAGAPRRSSLEEGTRPMTSTGAALR